MCPYKQRIKDILKKVSNIDDFLTVYGIEDTQLRYCCKFLSYASIEKGKYLMINGEVNLLDEAKDLFFIVIRGKLSLREIDLRRERNFDEYVRNSLIKRKSTKHSGLDITAVNSSFSLRSEFSPIQERQSKRTGNSQQRRIIRHLGFDE